MATEAELILKLTDQTAAGFKAIQDQFKQLRDNAKSTEKNLSDLGRGFKDFGTGLLGGFGIGLGFLTAKGAAELFASSVRALPSFLAGAVAHLVETGGKLTDMASKLGTNTEALQKLQVAGAPVGVSLDIISGAAVKMQKALVDTPEKFDRIGLSAAKLRSAGLDQQLAAISDKLRGIEDPALKASAAAGIFGKSFSEILPVLNSNMRETMEQAQALGLILSQDVVAAADDLGDAIGLLSATWDGFKNNIAAVVVTSQPLHKLIEGLTKILGEMSKGVNANRDGLRSFVDSAVVMAAKGLVALADAAQIAMDAWDALSLTVKSLVNLYLQAALAVTQFAVITQKFGGNKQAIADAEKEVAAIKAAIEKNSAAANKEVEANARRTDAVQKLRAGLAQLAKEVENSAGQVHKSTKETQDNTTAVGANAEALARAKREAEALFNFQIQTAKLAQKTQEEFFKNNERIASDSAKKLLDRLEEANKREEDRRAAAKARAEQEAEEFARLLDDMRDLGAAAMDLGEAIGGALGGVISFGGGALDVLARLNDDAIRDATTMQKLAGVVQGAASAFQSGSIFKGALAGASAGAAFGPIGAGIGAVAGGLLGLFGKAKKAREELEKMQRELTKLKDEALKANGGIEGLTKAFNRVGLDAASALGAKTTEEFKKAMDAFSEAAAAQQKRIEGLKTAMSGLDLMTKGFVATMERNGMSVDDVNGRLEKYRAKLKEAGLGEDELAHKINERRKHLQHAAEATDAQQASFSRLGNFAVAAFAGLVRETGDIIGALEQMGPTLDQLGKLMADFGFQASDAFARLLSLREIVTANQDVADSISGLAMLMKGLGEAGMITKGLLMDLGAQARANFDELIARSVPANEAMALMQPTLQELWEQQKRLGVTYDENTQKLIDQAEQQGLVGDSFLDVNEQMLEVLKIVAEMLGATLPDALKRMGDSAEREFDRMRDSAERAGDAAHGAIPGGSGGGGEGLSAPGMATGGIIRANPPFGTLIRAGEEGDEFLLNRRQMRAIQGGRSGSGDVFLDGHKVGKVMERREEIGTIAPKSRLRSVR